eukprot:380578-Pleurochrysis_carterae.AAC.1
MARDGKARVCADSGRKEGLVEVKGNFVDREKVGLAGVERRISEPQRDGFCSMTGRERDTS